MTDALGDWLRGQWEMEATEFAVDIDDARIACRGWNLAATEQPAIILVHGFRAHARWWDHIAPSLADRFRIVAFDFSGMGDSASRPAYSRAQHGREIAGVAAACGFDRPIVIAHSYGGIAAMTHAAGHPAAFGRLVVIDSALPAAEDGPIALRETPSTFHVAKHDIVARFRLIPPGRWPNAAILGYIAQHSVRESGGGWTWKFDPKAILSLNGDRTYAKEMVGISIPSDFLYGAQSEIATSARLARLSHFLPLAGAAIRIPLSHHHLMIEQPLALIAALRALLAKE